MTYHCEHNLSIQNLLCLGTEDKGKAAIFHSISYNIQQKNFYTMFSSYKRLWKGENILLSLPSNASNVCVRNKVCSGVIRDSLAGENRLDKVHEDIITMAFMLPKCHLLSLHVV